MDLTLEPEIGVPYSDKIPYLDLRARVEAACNTALALGLDLEPTTSDKEMAATLVTAYAADPIKTSQQVNHKRAARITPPALVAAKGILTQFGHSIVESSLQVRHLVTNKLIEETENPDPKVRLRALELLGKISDVALFAEKSEVTITHKTTDELRESLRTKLSKLINPGEEVEDAVFIDGEPIDVDAELGIGDDSV